jgi:VanZ family protein
MKNGWNPQHRVIFSWLAAALWMTLIFVFSSDDAADSNEKSDAILAMLGFLQDPFWLRKAAHFAEYSILGALTANAWRGTLALSRQKNRAERGNRQPVHPIRRKPSADACGGPTQETALDEPASGEPALDEPAAQVWRLRQRRAEFRRICLLSFLFCALYAATDEIHQMFVPGRAAGLADVAIDSAGAAAGAVLFALASRLRRLRRRR